LVVFLPAAGEGSFAEMVTDREDTIECLENQGEMLGGQQVFVGQLRALLVTKVAQFYKMFTTLQPHEFGLIFPEPTE